MGIVTTPQLHWMASARNRGLKASEPDYFDQLSSSLTLVFERCLIDLIPKKSGDNHPSGRLIVDCANGVGGEKLQVLKEKLNGLHVEIRNSGKEGILNEGVAADYVQKEKLAPHGFGLADVGIRSNLGATGWLLLCQCKVMGSIHTNSLSAFFAMLRKAIAYWEMVNKSSNLNGFSVSSEHLDGDADRLVYSTVISSGNNKINLVDGDKILSLFALFIKDQLSILRETDDKKEYQPRVGVIQTAYANGASTEYLKQLGLQVILTPTGVKYLHGKAEEYDIGIYFEANGHGRWNHIIYEHFLNWSEASKNEYSSTLQGIDKQNAAKRLWAVSKLINQAVGDALSGLLLVEAILQHMGGQSIDGMSFIVIYRADNLR